MNKMERPIYLTTTRLLYNMARVDFRYGRVSEEYVKMRQENWEREYNDANYESLYEPKHYNN